MICQQISDRHMCALALIKSGERLPIFNEEAAALFSEMQPLKLVDWNESERPVDNATRALGFGYAKIMQDGLSTLDDYRELGADV